MTQDEQRALVALTDEELIAAYLRRRDGNTEELLAEYKRRGWLNARMQTTAKYRHALVSFNDRQAYADLADEMNDGEAWVESDWEPHAVACARRWAEKHGLSFPPGLGDFDRLYEAQHERG